MTKKELEDLIAKGYGKDAMEKAIAWARENNKQNLVSDITLYLSNINGIKSWYTPAEADSIRSKAINGFLETLKHWPVTTSSGPEPYTVPAGKTGYENVGFVVIGVNDGTEKWNPGMPGNPAPPAKRESNTLTHFLDWIKDYDFKKDRNPIDTLGQKLNSLSLTFGFLKGTAKYGLQFHNKEYEITVGLLSPEEVYNWMKEQIEKITALSSAFTEKVGLSALKEKAVSKDATWADLTVFLAQAITENESHWTTPKREIEALQAKADVVDDEEVRNIFLVRAQGIIEKH